MKVEDMSDDNFSDLAGNNDEDYSDSDSDKRSYDEEPDDDDEKYEGESDNDKVESNSDESDEYKEKPESEDEEEEEGGTFSIDRLHESVHDTLRTRREEEGEVVEVRDTTLADPEERLGDDFEDTPWVPPTIELAWEHRLKKLYHGGTQKLSQIDLSTAADLGMAVPMYFSFIKVMSYAFFLMSLCSIPAIAFSYFGYKIPEESRDFIGLYKTTVGNIGHHQGDPDYVENTKCTVAAEEGNLCTDIRGIEFTMANVATILCTCEVLQVVIFLIAIRVLKKRCASLREKSDARSCTISAYSIMVQGIPKNATVEEITQFFSDLYPLDKPDWRGRPVLDGAQPLQHCDNTGKSFYVGSWVAETVIYQKLSSLISKFKAKQSVMKNLQRARAKMKMYNDDTSHADGPNPRRFAKAERQMLYYGHKLDELTYKTLKQAKKKMTLTRSKGQKLNISNGLINADSHAAFVTFNYSESMARCIEDYRIYESLPYSLFTPSCLKFKGHRLRVSRGPEPDEILWENVEVAGWRKFLHRLATTVVALLLLIVGFAIILQASLKKEEFNENVPNLEICEVELPALYAGMPAYEIPSGTEFIRPNTGKNELGQGRAQYDAICNQVVPNSFYAVYSINGNFDSNDDLLTTYEESACQSNLYDNGVVSDCPIFNSSSFCPCISHTSSDTCDTVSCSFEDMSDSCTHFASSTIAGCYCYETLLHMFEGSVMDVLANVQSNDACNAFFLNYSLAISLALLASLCTVVINIGLRVTMKVLGKQECHNTIDEEQRAICVKQFLTIYINSAFVALLAFGSIKGSHAVMKQTQVLEGEYSDFDAAWYAQVGSLLLLTFILQALGPLNFKFLKVHCYTPCRMRCAHPKIVSQSSHKFAMQADVDNLELSGVFDTTQHTAQLLALLFFAMTYSGGLPLLTPLMGITFVIYYRGDKRLLCKYYEKPPKIGSAIMDFVLNVLPWAAVIRLCASTWMYSNELVFPESDFTMGAVPDALGFNWQNAADKYNDFMENQEGRDLGFGINAGHRLTRATVFPLVVVLALIVILDFGRAIILYSPLHLVYQLCRIVGSFFWRCCCMKGIGKKKKVKGIDLMAKKDPLRTEMAPYTGDYFHYARSEYIKQGDACCKALRHLVTDDLTDEEIATGWRMTYIGEHKVKMITWENNTRVNGVFRKKGSTQRTYEVIGQYGCWSYVIYRIPQYRSIMMAIQEGMESILQDIEHDEELREHHNDKDSLDDKESKGEVPYVAAKKRLSVIDRYNQKHEDKKAAEVAAEKSRRKQWEKPHMKKSSKVYADEDVYAEPGEELSSDDDSDDSDGVGGLV